MIDPRTSFAVPRAPLAPLAPPRGVPRAEGGQRAISRPGALITALPHGGRELRTTKEVLGLPGSYAFLGFLGFPYYFTRISY